jgi:hypothetical protein
MLMPVLDLVPANEVQGVSGPVAGTLAPAEYGYFFVIFYTVFGAPFGLTQIGGIGAGFLLIPVLVLCMVSLGSAMFAVLRTAWIPVACGASYLFIQLAVHGESMTTMYVYQFGPWLFAVVIVQALCIYRPNFLHRFVFFTLLLGLGMLPFMSLSQTGAYERIGLEANVGFGNPNEVAAWFGFCVVCMTIKGYLETRTTYRVVFWLAAAFSFYMLTLTTSRGALLSVAIALMTASRQFVKLGLWPFVLLTGLIGGIIQLGLFDEAVRSYSIRAEEETGRFRVWPILIDQFLNSPFVGNGASHAGAFTHLGEFITPHNPFLLIAVASGVIPLALFCSYCLRSAFLAFRSSSLGNLDSHFYLPLVVYTILGISGNNLEFMTPWAVVSLAVPVAVQVSSIDRNRSPALVLHGAGETL